MDLEILISSVMMERFPFLKHYIGSDADIRIAKIDDALAQERPGISSGFVWEGGYRLSRCDIFLLNEAGEKIGVVGEVPKLLRTKKLFGITLRREKLVTRKFPETVQEALNRIEGGFYILIIENTSIDYSQRPKVSLYIPPDGQTAKMYLAQVLEEAHLKEKLRLKKIEEQRAAAVQEALDVEAARLDAWIRIIKEC